MADTIKGKTVPTGGDVVEKFGVLPPDSVIGEAPPKVAAPGAVMSCVAVLPDDVLPEVLELLLPDVLLPDVLLPDVLLPDVLLPDVLLPDVLLPDVLLGVVLSEAPPPPPPPEQAVRASRHTEAVRRTALHDVSMIPPIVILSGAWKLPSLHTKMVGSYPAPDCPASSVMAGQMLFGGLLIRRWNLWAQKGLKNRTMDNIGCVLCSSSGTQSHKYGTRGL